MHFTRMVFFFSHLWECKYIIYIFPCVHEWCPEELLAIQLGLQRNLWDTSKCLSNYSSTEWRAYWFSRSFLTTQLAQSRSSSRSRSKMVHACHCCGSSRYTEHLVNISSTGIWEKPERNKTYPISSYYLKMQI